MTERVVSIRYPSRAARIADFWVHVVGLVLAVAGGIVLLALSARNETSRVAAIAVYATGMVSMLAFSLAYNFSSDQRRPLLRRLDHSGIFLMIAGSYTPVTTYVLTGGWAWGMTVAIWTIALLGILGKMFVPRLPEPIWIGLYLAQGWMVVVAIRPIVEGLNWPALALLALGGITYSIGVVFHVNERLAFSRPLWHGHVVLGAGLQWVAILIGIVLPTAG